ncbi:MAG TPA: glycosyltransferase family 4 protein [Vicinamibacteria bacterium]
MRVAVVEFAGRGGMTHYAYQMSRGLSAAGLDVTLVTDRHYELDELPHPFRLEKILRLWDAKPSASSSGMVRRVRRVARALVYYREWVRTILFLRAQRFDLVQLGDLRFASDLVCILTLRLLGIRLVDVCHNVRPFSSHGRGGSFRFSRLGRVAFQRVYRHFERVVLHFEVNRRAFQSTFDLPSERLVVIPMGNESIFEEMRDEQVTPAVIRARLDLRQEERVVMFFGTISFYKGIDLLMRAFARVHGEHPDTKLVVAGHPLSGFDMDDLKHEARTLGIESDTIFVARYIEIPEVAAWIELASVVVFPYRDVYQSAAVQVAQTMGAPTIVTNVGAMDEVVTDGETGLLVPVEDVDALIEAMDRVLGDDAFAKRLGDAARRDATSRFSWEAIGRKLASCYLEMRPNLPREAQPSVRSTRAAR